MMPAKVKPASRHDAFLRQLELLAYDLVGLPMAVRVLLSGKTPGPARAPDDYLHTVYGWLYWRKRSALAILRTALAILLFPVAFPISIFIYTRRNGAIIARRTGKPIWKQVTEQIAVGLGQSVVPYWYYMFELHEDAHRAHAGRYLQRHETKGPAYGYLQPGHDDGMQDKLRFAEICASAGANAVPVLVEFTEGVARAGTAVSGNLPPTDIFVKPRIGRGGRHAERWDWRDGSYQNPDGDILSSEALFARIARMSGERSYIVQPRMANHPELADLNNGALATVRIVTIRNEIGGYEATDAAFRMAMGANHTVDNFHAGGIAGAVEMATGRLGPASNMGTDARVGWHVTHPTSGAQIEGRILPHWQALKELACRAHAAFPGRTIVGWDIAILAEGPCVVEGNTRPDLDIHQRVARAALGGGRLCELLAYNLRRAMA